MRYVFGFSLSCFLLGLLLLLVFVVTKGGVSFKEGGRGCV